MPNPILVDVERGSVSESAHRGALAVCDPDGRLVFARGDVSRPVIPRSAVKAFQAVPLVVEGAADRFGLGGRALALACASHGGEPSHVATARAMLAACALDEAALGCGAHWPSHKPSARALVRDGQSPCALHNNCSGKHAGFLCAAVHAGASVESYLSTDHKVQAGIRRVLEIFTGVRVDPGLAVIDGCSAPSQPLPLDAMATAFARLGTGLGVPADFARSARRLREAVAGDPFFVAGTNRFDTAVMARLGARAFIKTGAEGVYAGALPEQGLGFAVKIDDGAKRASEAVCASLLTRFLTLGDDDRAFLQELAEPALTNWRGTTIGRLRVTAEVTA